MMTSACSCNGFWSLLSEVTVEPVLLLYMLSTFSQYALFQDLVYSKVCWVNYNATVCDHLHSEEYKSELDNVQRTSSHWILMSTISLVVPSILISIYLGSWSDRYGRKWPVALPPLGGIMACFVYIIMSFKPQSSVGWICLASSLSGLSGGFASCIMSCMTYVASISSEENRTLRISRLEAMTFVGGTIGPFISGSMLEVTGHGYAFIFMMICYCLAFLYTVFIVRDVHGESIDDERVSPGELPAPDLLPINVQIEKEQKTVLLPHSHCKRLNHVDHEEEEDFTYNEEESTDINEIVDHTNINENINHQISGIPPRVANVENNHSSRPSIGSGESNSSSRNSSARNDDSGSGSGLEDERQIISSNNRGPETEIPHTSHIKTSNRNSESESCCSTYFGARHFFDAVKTAWKMREDNKRLYLNLVIAAGFITMMITAGELDVAYLFARDKPLKWSYKTYSYYFGFKYGLGAFSLLLGMPLLQKLQLRDSTICIIGMFSRMAGLTLYGVSYNSYMAFCVPVVAIFSFFTIPATRALLSKLVAPSEQGKMFAFVAIMEDLCTLFASTFFNSVYPLTRPILHGFIFLLAAGLLIIPIFIMWSVGNRLKKISLYDSQGYETASSLEPSIENHGTSSRRSVIASDEP